ncbi:MAG: Uma2 family endonuclease [Leptolyngbya sp. IPPAS B-1204]|nr:Uma2 family endonuclease [Elainella sp. C42_A2020_010]RNJ67646.1 MAG: Uma2 family endonuclease [Leptolyngbya sp. IPPAS B-1204]
MVSQLQSSSKLIYPESDGKPMADNTEQFRWIVIIQQNLDWLFANDPNVFVAGDLLWYPVEGNSALCTAPDVLVVFGRSKGKRGSYQQWQEGNIPPQVVFEILSPSNKLTEMNKKQVFYNRYGVEEYYLYDPEHSDLSGWLRVDGALDVIDPIENWVSPRLGIRFDLSGPELQIYRPDGQRFLSYVEIAQQAEQERQRAEQERQRAERLAERLRELGVDPDQITG